MKESVKYIIEVVRKVIGGMVKGIVVEDEMIYISVERDELIKVLKLMKKHGGIKMEGMVDLYCVDYPERKKRFEINYVLMSYRYNIRVTIKINISEEEVIETTMEEYKSAGWLEREVWDMYGVYFVGHKDLRRILTDYGFEGHPLRKDYPLSGYTEVRYDEEQKRVVMEGIEITQEFRYFDYSSPWENKV